MRFEKNKRFKSIDSLRGIAAFVVMLHHYFSIYGRDYKHSFKVPRVFDFGFYGVELFFIISGFVIYYTIHYCADAKEFLTKRFIRLFPTYWLCVILTFIIVSLFPLVEFRNTQLWEAVVNFSMLNGLIGVRSVDPSYWSLLIELFFYGMMAVIYFSKLSCKLNMVLFCWLILIIFYNEVHKLPVLGAFLNLRYGSLFVSGICFYKIKMEKARDWQPVLLLVLSYLCSILVLRDLDGSLIAISLIYLLFTFALFSNMKLLEVRPLVFLGNISYALYLIHQNIGFVIINQLRGKEFTGFYIVLLPISICIFLAWLITVFFEKKAGAYLKSKLLK